MNGWMSSDDFLVLHALAVKRRSEVDGLLRATSRDEGWLAGSLERHAGAGLVSYHDGRIPGWVLTPKGRETHTEAIAVQRAGNGAALDDWYDEFLPLNRRFKELCGRWQLEAAGTPQALDELAEIHDLILKLLGQLSARVSRLDAYAPRFGSAHAAIVAGHHEFLLRPFIGSYHDIWMELHEDLLLTLGRTREEE